MSGAGHDLPLDLLACPTCRRVLMSGDEELHCTHCDARYPIVRGIPRFIAPDALASDEVATRAQFGEEFRERATDRDFDDPALLQFLFATRTGIDPVAIRHLGTDHYPTAAPCPADLSFLRGKRVLDAGCGPGRFTKVVAEHAAAVVALDFGEHVERARSRTAGQGNVTVIQGSILEPPLALRSFDFVFSIGVLHHTADAALGAARLCELVADEGEIAIWVYPQSYWGDPLRAQASRAVHALMSRLPAATAMTVVRRVLYPLGRIQAAAARRRWTKVLAAPLFILAVPRHPSRDVMISTIYDRFCPRIITTHRATEVASWLAAGGMGYVEVLPVPSSARGRRARASG